MSKKNLFLFLVLLVALFFRFYNLTSIPPGLYPDEAMNGNNALEALATKNFKVYYEENNGREGLFINIQALFLALIQKNEPYVLRLPSAIFGFITVLGIYFFVLELFKNIKNYKLEKINEKEEIKNSKIKFNEKVALLSAFFLGTSFWHINFSRIGFRAILAPFFLVWALYLILKSLNNNYQKILAFFAGIFFGLGFYTYIAYRVMILIFIPILWFYFKEAKLKNKLKEFYLAKIIFVLGMVLIALPIGWYYLNNPEDFFGRTSQISVFNSSSPIKDLILNIFKTLFMFNFVGDFNWRHNLSGRPELDVLVGVLFVIGILILLKNRKNSEIQFINYILFGWFSLAMLPVVISNEGIPHALRAILMVIPAVIFAAIAGIIIYEKLILLKNKKTINIIFGIFLVVVFLNTYYAYFVLWANNKNTYDAFSSNYVELGKILNSLPQNLPKYVLVEASGVEVRGIPMPAQTTMFITNTFLPQNQKAKNIFYILPQDKDKIPEGSLIFEIK
jgi:4-amino-4-deoxy-L-arabinose transferase-like glycosyltransferase